jgi:hypothetical protein
MRKVFNEVRVNNLFKKFNSLYYFKDISIEDIRNGNVFKKLRKRSDIEYTSVIYHFANSEERKTIEEKFFPTKFASLNEQYTTENFYYWNIDSKIHWIVDTPDGERHFKLKTDNFTDRIPDLVNKGKLNLKKEIDSLYGYWLIETENGFFITDLNKDKNGYRKLIEDSESNDLIHTIFNKNSFADIAEYNEARNFLIG